MTDYDADLDSAFVRCDHCKGVELSVEPNYEIQDLNEVARIATGE